jgi:hypothetical protein
MAHSGDASGGGRFVPSSGMTIVDRSSMRAQDVLDATRDLAPSITARAAEVEAARRIPQDLLDQLPPAQSYETVQFPTPEQSDAQSAQIAEQWGPKVAGG